MSEQDERIFDWRLVKAGEVAPVKGGHGSWVETDHPAVIACMGSAPECAANGCQAERLRAETVGVDATMAAGLLLKLKEECEAQHARAEVADARVQALIEVLKLLKRGECWCEIAIGNPMVTHHSAGCAAAQMALAPPARGDEK